MKYSFSLFAISRGSIICSLSMLSSVGKELVDILGLFAVRRCCQIAFVSLRFVTAQNVYVWLSVLSFLSCFCIVCSRSNYFCFCCYLYFSGFHNFWRKPVRQTFGFYSSGFDRRMSI